MLNFTKEEMQKYVENQLSTSEIIEAKKIGNTYAVRGIEGQEVITYAVDSNGNEVIERVQSVTLDEETKEPGWILTKVDSNNQPVIDQNGHPNQYIVADSVFKKTYEPSIDGPNLYSKSQIEKFIRLEEDIHFGTKYGDMTVMQGGYAKITDMSRISGISENDFNDTYVVVEKEKEHTL